jgi:hypothetical protein
MVEFRLNGDSTIKW